MSPCMDWGPLGPLVYQEAWEDETAGMTDTVIVAKNLHQPDSLQDGIHVSPHFAKVMVEKS